MIGLLGITTAIAFAIALSKHRRHISVRLIFIALIMQFGIGLALHRVPFLDKAFDLLTLVMVRILGFADDGAAFLFGNLAHPVDPWGFIFIIRVLAVIVFFSSLIRILYRLGVMQIIIGAISTALRRTLKITGAEAVACAANIFVGQTEAPFAIRPYLKSMTLSQITVLMASGFATISGSLLGAYVLILGGSDTELQASFAKHLMTASLMSAPAAILFARVLMPETDARSDQEVVPSSICEDATILEAAANGAIEGMTVALRVGAVALAFVALLAMLDWPLKALSSIPSVEAFLTDRGIGELSISHLFGLLLAPVCLLMGVGQEDILLGGGILGQQVVANEFIAYSTLAEYARQETMEPKSIVILSYAICGFSNLLSIGLQAAALTALEPSRREDFVRIAPRAMLAGVLACWSTGCVASVIL